jgi:transcriptional regulator with XRE-family HTH domain
MVTTTNPATIDTTIDMTFAERLTTLRHQQALTQQALAERANTHISNIRRYEAGTSTPTLDALRNLALALNTSADTLIFDPEERQPHDDLKHAFEAASTRLDPEGKEHLKATLEGLLLRTEARRWTA